MKLIFVRHGQATAYCADDAGRNLTPFGQEQARQSAMQLLNHYQPDVIISSPYNRAKQTALAIYELAKHKGQSPDFIHISSITPDDDPKQGLDDIAQLILDKYGVDNNELCVVVVCHMPIVARMVQILDELPYTPFALAQYKVFSLEVIAAGLACQIDEFCPNQPD